MMKRKEAVTAVLVCLALTALAAPQPVQGQQLPNEVGEPRAGTIQEDKLASAARVYLQITEVREDIHTEMSESHDPAGRAALRERADRRIEEIFQEHNLTPKEYEEISYIVGTDQEQGELFDQMVERLREAGSNQE